MKLRRQNKREKTYKDLGVTTSWDDGQKLDLKLAELLTKYGLKSTFYITKYLHEPFPLEKQDVIEIDREHEIGAHTLNHVDLTNIPISEAKRGSTVIRQTELQTCFSPMESTHNLHKGGYGNVV